MKKIVTSVAAALSLLVAASLSFAVEVKTPDIKGAAAGAATAAKDTKAAAKGAVVDTKAAAKGAVSDTKAAAKTTATDTKAAAKSAVVDTKAAAKTTVTDTKAAAKGAVADTKATAGAAKDKAKAAVAAPAAAAAEPIDINTATEAQLKTIPGIGDAYAAKIIAGRPYTNKAQLKSKNIIPEQAYDKVKDAIVAKRSAKGKKK